MEIEDGGSLRLLGEGSNNTTSFTSVVNTVYWSGETTVVKTYIPDRDSSTAVTENWYEIAVECREDNPDLYSSASVHEATISLTGQIATFTTEESDVLMVSSPSITCCLSGITWANIHSITLLGGNAVYYITNDEGTILDSKNFSLNSMDPILTIFGSTWNYSSGSSWTYNTLTDIPLVVQNNVYNNTYNLNIEINATIRYGLCHVCANFTGLEVLLSGSSSVWAELEAQAVQYTLLYDTIRFKFVHEDGNPISQVGYSIYYDNDEVSEGITSTEYLYVFTDGTKRFDHLVYSRLGCTDSTSFQENPWYLTPDKPYTEVYVGHIPFKSYTITLESNGEVASVQRIEELFNIQLHNNPGDPPAPMGYPMSLNECYSRSQQPMIFIVTPFIYSDIANNEEYLTLRVSDYLKLPTPILDGPDVLCSLVYGLDKQDTVDTIISCVLSASRATSVTLGNLGSCPTLWGLGQQNLSLSEILGRSLGCMADQGFVLYRNSLSAPTYDPSVYATYKTEQIISGTVAQLTGIQANAIRMVSPEIHVSVSASSYGNYHSTTYISGSTKLQLVDLTNSTIIFEEAYNLNGYNT